MPYTCLTIEVADRIATLTVNRPDKLNALNDTTIRELGLAAEELRARDDVAGIFVTGAGSKAFVAGADIGELASLGAMDARTLSQHRLAPERVVLRDVSPMALLAAICGGVEDPQS